MFLLDTNVVSEKGDATLLEKGDATLLRNIKG